MTLEEYITQFISYDARSPSGLTWVGKPACKVVPGRPALACLGRNGYFTGTVMGRQMYAHRVVWFVVNGHWPTGQIDHIDGKRDNNVYSNLRDVPQELNAKNMRMLSTNTSGFTGVFFDPRDSRFYAGYCLAGRRVNVKCDGSLFDAVASIISARAKQGDFTPRHGR